MTMFAERVDGPALLWAKTSTGWQFLKRLFSPFRVWSHRQGIPGPLIFNDSDAGVAVVFTHHFWTRAFQAHELLFELSRLEMHASNVSVISSSFS